MLKPGGELLYSTCTFSPIENEGLISFILENFPEIELLTLDDYEGFTKGCPDWGNKDTRLKKCIRIFPHHMEGEGHFLALMKKNGCSVSSTITPTTKPDKTSKKLLDEFFKNMSQPLDFNRIDIRNENVYYLPEADTASLKGIKFLRNGLFLGELKKNRFEPSHALSHYLKPEQIKYVQNIELNDETIFDYLRGNVINTGESRGWVAVAVEGFRLDGEKNLMEC